ncbi:MAG: ATP-binding protein [Thaumarchaeota archaeon]|nr:ATP-binding protein [Nitrososphaerota archaeon]
MRRIDYLQRIGLAQQQIPVISPERHITLDRRALLRVKGIGRIKKELLPNSDQKIRPLTEDLLTGLYNYGIPVAFSIRGDSKGVSIYLGTWSENRQEKKPALDLDRKKNIFISLLNSIYPAVDIDPKAGELPLSDLPVSGYAIGMPTVKENDALDISLQLDKMIRSMAGMNWASLVLAEPIPEKEITGLRNIVTNEMRFAQQSAQQGATKQLAEYYTKLLQNLLERLTIGLEMGCWRTAVYLLGDHESYYRLASVWRAVFTGKESLPETLMVLDDERASSLAKSWSLPDEKVTKGPGYYQHPYQFQSLLSSIQLASYVHLPNSETNGFNVNIIPDFDAVPQEVGSDKVVSLGEVIHRTRNTKIKYSIPIESLKKHVFVSGVTGAGKTTTLFHMLMQLTKNKVPFLIIEPSKTEYRALINDPTVGKELQIFTAGDEKVSPFRLNPFEFPSGIPVGVHLDMLRSVFSVSFGMWSPLPQVLEQCLFEIYKDKGWEITSGENTRLEKKTQPVPAAFPTLTDLFNKVDDVTRQLGYEQKITDDIRAALQTRLNSLRSGGKGRMLDVQSSLPAELWMEKSTVLELEKMGDDDDKAFLMGLLFIRLVEHRRLKEKSKDLKHLLVIEEAHRLLTNVSTQQRQEESNPRGKAVETFSNMLSEVRAYGQGMVIADQVPVKLAPDVIKNTNLKISHRIVASDDREALAGAMHMTENQTEALSNLTKGEAAVFAEGDDVPLMIKVGPEEEIKKLLEISEKWPKGDEVAEKMKPKMAEYQKYYKRHPALDDKTEIPDTEWNTAFEIFQKSNFKRDLVRFVISISEDSGLDNNGAISAIWSGITADVNRFLKHGVNRNSVLLSLIIIGTDWLASRRGVQAGWTYTKTELFASYLRSTLKWINYGKDFDEKLKALRKTMLYFNSRVIEPFKECHNICNQKGNVCMYRHTVSDFISFRQDMNKQWISALNEDFKKNSDLSDMTNSLKFCQNVVPNIVNRSITNKDTARRIGLCFAQHMVSRELPESQAHMIKNLIRQFDLLDTRNETKQN